MERNIKLLALFNFFTDFKLYSAILVLYYVKVTGSFSLAMSIYSVVYISAAIFEVPTGVFSDKIGRKTTLSLGALSALIAAVVTAIGLHYWFLFVGAIFAGLSRSFFSGNNDALLHDSLKALKREHQFDHYLGRISAMFQAALTVGAVLGSVVAHWSFTWVMWLSVIPQGICFLLSIFITEPPRYTKQSTNIFVHLSSAVSLLWKNKNLRKLGINQIVGFGIGEAAFEFKSAFIATLWPIWAVGFAKMMSFVGGGISFWYSSALIRKFGAGKLMLYEAIINRFINTVSLVFPTVASPAVMSSTSFFYGATEVASCSLMQKDFTDHERATLASVTSLGGSVFLSVFAVLLGWVADRFSPAGALLFAEICMLPRVFLLWSMYHKTT